MDLDFRPGTSLGNVVSVFTAAMRPNLKVVKALSQREQLETSRCRVATNGRLGCITCHDPHVQLQGAESTTYFRRKCLACHTADVCSLSAAKRRVTSPADNCIQCHMPKKTVTNIGHSALTDYRILRIPTEISPDATLKTEHADDLIYWTRPPDGPAATPGLRALALAYCEVGQSYPQFQQRGFEELEKAAREFPNDAEVQGAYGLVLLAARPGSSAEAATALQKAVDSGSTSVEVRTRLARLRVKNGNIAAGMELYNEAIKADPYYTPASFGLAYLYVIRHGRQATADTLRKILTYDPGNEEARRALANAEGNSKQE